MMNLHNIHFSKFKATIFLENLKDLKAKIQLIRWLYFQNTICLYFKPLVVLLFLAILSKVFPTVEQSVESSNLEPP